MGIPLSAERKRYLEALFPMLARRAYVVRDGPSNTFNCIAWAMGSTSEWWWPDMYSLWPIRERRVTVACFATLLESEGFEPAEDAMPETGYVKIAMYVLDGVPTHMARIESAAVWSSKLGRDELIEHEPDALNGAEYGAPAFFFRKKR
jgi:hypothetical protein